MPFYEKKMLNFHNLAENFAKVGVHQLSLVFKRYTNESIVKHFVIILSKNNKYFSN